MKWKQVSAGGFCAKKVTYLLGSELGWGGGGLECKACRLSGLITQGHTRASNLSTGPPLPPTWQIFPQGCQAAEIPAKCLKFGKKKVNWCALLNSCQNTKIKILCILEKKYTYRISQSEGVVLKTFELLTNHCILPN